MSCGSGVRTERRAWPRRSRLNHDSNAAARLIPGRSVDVIDLSRGGALIESNHRLLPGTEVELHLVEPDKPRRVRGRIVRCHVAVLDRERGIRYRGALMFEEPIIFE